MRRIIRLFGVSSLALLLSGVAAPAIAQVAITTADIQGLQDEIYEAGLDVGRLRSRDAQLASQLQSELDLLREEAIYLKVKMRRESSVPRSEYYEVRDRLQNLRSSARLERSTTSRNDTSRTDSSRGGVATSSSQPTRRTDSNTLDVGTELDVRLQTTLDSATAQVEDRFDATTVVDVMSGERVLIPAGSVLRGVVTSIERASRTDRTSSMTLAFDQITVQGRSYPVRATVTQALETEGIKEEVGRIGTGAGVGAIIGGILGGVKGALAGILIGAGGTVAATEGKDLVLPSGTVLRVRLDTPLTVR